MPIAADDSHPEHQEGVYVYLRVRHGAESAPVVAIKDGAANGGRSSPGIICEVTAPYRGRFSFPFDGCVFPGAATAAEEQRALFELSGRPLIDHAFRGFNAALVAYGQTGSGKTHSVFGPRRSFGSDMEGLVPRVCRAIFSRAEVLSAVQGIQTFVTASLLEVYLDDVFDLFQDRKQLRVRQNAMSPADGANVTFSVTGARTIEVQSYEEVAGVLRDAEPLRTVAVTAVHDRSSRAHTLFELRVRTVAPDGVQLASKLVIADLAGSERVREAKTEIGVAFEQACSINKSLLALGSCVEAAVCNRTGEFRTSTLTKLLKEYIGGSAVTSVLVTISPEAKDVSATLQTLRFCERLKFVRSTPRVNKSMIAEPAAEQAVQNSGQVKHVPTEIFQQRKALLESEMTLEHAMEQLSAARANVVSEHAGQGTDDGSPAADILRNIDVELGELERQLGSVRSQMPVGKQLAESLDELALVRGKAASLELQFYCLEAENMKLRSDLCNSQSEIAALREREARLVPFEQKYKEFTTLQQFVTCIRCAHEDIVRQETFALTEAKINLLSQEYHSSLHILGVVLDSLRDEKSEALRQVSQLQRRAILLEADRRVQAENARRELARVEEQHKFEVEALVTEFEESAKAAERCFKQTFDQKLAEAEAIVRHCAVAQRALGAAIAAAGLPESFSPQQQERRVQPQLSVLQPRPSNAGERLKTPRPMFVGDTPSLSLSPQLDVQHSPTSVHC